MNKLLIVLLFFTGMVKAQIVTIPDANFKARLLSSNTMTNQIAMDGSENYLKIDANSDGEIQLSEAEAVHFLIVVHANISDLTGIESFTNLRQLYCNDNALTELNINSLTHMTVLGCNSNLLTQLNITNLVNLEYLRCSNNPITAIDFSTLVNLTYLDCSSIAATNLDFSSLISLQSLLCRNLSLAQLDVTGMSNLAYLNCSNNALTSLHIENLEHLENLQCDSNQLTTVDFTGVKHLTYCILSNNQLTDLVFEYLTYITVFDIRNNQIQDLDLSNIYFGDSIDAESSVLYTGNPLRTLNMKNGRFDGMSFFNAINDIDTWEFICADEMEAYLVVLNLPGLTNLVVNSYCSFTPGGNYNTISGNVKYDLDNNGCDAADINFPDIRVNINDGTNQGAAFTTASGNYTFYTLGGNFDITPAVENAAWFNITPPTISIPFADNNSHTANQDFCIAPVGVHPDLEVVIAPDIQARPGFDVRYRVVYKNKGNQVLSGNVSFAYEDAVLDFMNAIPAPDTQNTGLLLWNYTDLLPFESRSFYIVLHLNGPTDSPSVNLGDVLDFEATITPLVSDEIPADNVFAFHQTVVDSYSVNAINCLEGEVVAPTEIGNYLHYAINFENTGTAAAENIVVKMIVEASEFDISSLQLINTSFPVDTRITGNQVEFIFSNVNLDIGGHGHILLKIKTNSNLVVGDSVSRSALVFFDYNAPVDTGLAETVFQNLSNTDFDSDTSVMVSPNPAVNEVVVKADNVIKSIQLYDAQGRIIVTALKDDTTSTLDISHQATGIYFIKITTAKGVTVRKLLKQ